MSSGTTAAAAVTPDSPYFCPTLGAPALAEALAEHAPAAVTLDLTSADDPVDGT